MRITLTLLLLCCACGPGTAEPAHCPRPDERARISLEFHREVDQACPASEWKGKDVTACPGYVTANQRYEQRQRSWARCQ